MQARLCRWRRQSHFHRGADAATIGYARATKVCRPEVASCCRMGRAGGIVGRRMSRTRCSERRQAYAVCASLTALPLRSGTALIRDTRVRPGETMPPILHWSAVIGCVALALPASRARAEDYPSRTVTIVAPSAPGGMYSILARLIGGKLERLWANPFIVENRPGASSVTARSRSALRARRLYADGGNTSSPRDQRRPAQEPALRSAHRFRSDRADRAASPRCCWSTRRCRCGRSRISPRSPARLPAG